MSRRIICERASKLSRSYRDPEVSSKSVCPRRKERFTLAMWARWRQDSSLREKFQVVERWSGPKSVHTETTPQSPRGTNDAAARETTGRRALESRFLGTRNIYERIPTVLSVFAESHLVLRRAGEDRRGGRDGAARRFEKSNPFSPRHYDIVTRTPYRIRNKLVGTVAEPASKADRFMLRRRRRRVVGGGYGGETEGGAGGFGGTSAGRPAVDRPTDRPTARPPTMFVFTQIQLLLLLF